MDYKWRVARSCQRALFRFKNGPSRMSQWGEAGKTQPQDLKQKQDLNRNKTRTDARNPSVHRRWSSSKAPSGEERPMSRRSHSGSQNNYLLYQKIASAISRTVITHKIMSLLRLFSSAIDGSTPHLKSRFKCQFVSPTAFCCKSPQPRPSPALANGPISRLHRMPISAIHAVPARRTKRLRHSAHQTISDRYRSGGSRPSAANTMHNSGK